ncbi:MAG TPA: DUF4224 domain-containing protein [Burkholderiales bacterium]|nr:DUF4224 domain-containing protein [Burkholderiales bacterium]
MSDDGQLTPEQIFNMTGKVQPAAQIRHLRRMGVKAERSANPERPVCVVREWLTPATAKIEAKSGPRLKSERNGSAS